MRAHVKYMIYILRLLFYVPTVSCGHLKNRDQMSFTKSLNITYKSTHTQNSSPTLTQPTTPKSPQKPTHSTPFHFFPPSNPPFHLPIFISHHQNHPFPTTTTTTPKPILLKTHPPNFFRARAPPARPSGPGRPPADASGVRLRRALRAKNRRRAEPTGRMPNMTHRAKNT